MTQHRILGLDPGEKRIGVAISDELGMLAHPRETLQVENGKIPINRLCEIIATENVKIIVIGLPRNMDGSEGASAEKSRGLAALLKEHTACTIQFWDERLSTVAAQRSLHESGKNTRKSRPVIDQVAAQFILQGYLDSQAMI